MGILSDHAGGHAYRVSESNRRAQASPVRRGDAWSPGGLSWRAGAWELTQAAVTEGKVHVNWPIAERMSGVWFVSDGCTVTAVWMEVRDIEADEVNADIVGLKAVDAAKIIEDAPPTGRRPDPSVIAAILGAAKEWGRLPDAPVVWANEAPPLENK